MIWKDHVAIVAAVTLDLSERRVDGKLFVFIWNIGIPTFKIVVGFITRCFYQDEAEDCDEEEHVLPPKRAEEVTRSDEK